MEEGCRLIVKIAQIFGEWERENLGDIESLRDTGVSASGAPG